MILLYLLMMMWPPPHLLISVGVWRRESPAYDASFARLGSGLCNQERDALDTSRGRRQLRLPVSAS